MLLLNSLNTGLHTHGEPGSILKCMQPCCQYISRLEGDGREIRPLPRPQNISDAMMEYLVHIFVKAETFDQETVK